MTTRRGPGDKCDAISRVGKGFRQIIIWDEFPSVVETGRQVLVFVYRHIAMWDVMAILHDKRLRQIRHVEGSHGSVGLEPSTSS
jgi:hypothetical protein